MDIENLESAIAALGPIWRKQFMQREGVIQIPGHRGVAALIDPEGTESLHPPWRDHYALWARDGVPVIYTFEPYGLTGEGDSELKAFCDENGLEHRVQGRSFHNPGVSVLVVIKPRRKIH